MGEVRRQLEGDTPTSVLASAIRDVRRQLDALERRTARPGWTGRFLPLSGGELMPQGVLGYAQATSIQSGIGTTETDLVGLSLTIAIPDGRLIRVSAEATVIWTDAAANIDGRIYDGATRISNFARSRLGRGPLDNVLRHHGSRIYTPSAGTRTFKCTLQATAGTAHLEAFNSIPAYLLVEDLGAA